MRAGASGDHASSATTRGDDDPQIVNHTTTMFCRLPSLVVFHHRDINSSMNCSPSAARPGDVDDTVVPQ